MGFHIKFAYHNFGITHKRRGRRSGMKEGRLQKWFGQAGAGLSREMDRARARPGARRAAFLFVRFAMGFLLSQAVIFSGYAPFGVGLAAAGGAGMPGFFGILGALCGYMFLSEISVGLKYIAITVLVFAAGFVFQGSSAARRSLFMPLVAFAATAFVGIVFVAGDGFPPLETLLYAAELILAAGSAYFFRIALRPVRTARDCEPPAMDLRRLMSLLILLSCLFLSLSQVKLFGGLSPARCLTVLLVMLLAYRGGVGAGSAAGLSMGVALDLAAGTPFFSMAYGLTGLIGGAFQSAGKLACACVCVLVTAVSALWTGDGSLRLFVMLETFAASVAFMLIPDKALPFLSTAAPRRGMEEDTTRRLRDHVQFRLRSSAAAFRDLYESLVGSFTHLSHTNDEDIATVFDRTSDRVCKKCALAGVCWDREALSTFHTLSDTASSMLRKASLEPTDFPAYFSSRCLNFNRFVAVGNEELAALLYRRQFKLRLRESRLQLCHQYAELSRILQWLSEEAGETVEYDWGAENRLARYLQSKGVEGRVAVSADPNRRARVDIMSPDLSELVNERKKTTHDLSVLLGVRLGQPDQERGSFGERLTFMEAEPLAVAVGVAAHKKQGQTVSGDSGTYFKTNEGKLYLLLSDGMGSGREAALESGMAVRLLERFLRAGIQPETALGMLNSALILKGEQELGFVTVDLVSINLLNGEVVFHKYGAAPSYIKRGRKVNRVTSGALPAGLAVNGLVPVLDVTRIKVNPGDIILLASDGVAVQDEDEWLRQALADWGEGSPRELAGQVLEAAVREHGRRDDMTVLAVRLERKRPQPADDKSAVSANAPAAVS